MDTYYGFWSVCGIVVGFWLCTKQTKQNWGKAKRRPNQTPKGIFSPPLPSPVIVPSSLQPPAIDSRQRFLSFIVHLAHSVLDNRLNKRLKMPKMYSTCSMSSLSLNSLNCSIFGYRTLIPASKRWFGCNASLRKKAMRRWEGFSGWYRYFFFFFVSSHCKLTTQLLIMFLGWC